METVSTLHESFLPEAVAPLLYLGEICCYDDLLPHTKAGAPPASLGCERLPAVQCLPLLCIAAFWWLVWCGSLALCFLIFGLSTLRPVKRQDHVLLSAGAGGGARVRAGMKSHRAAV